MELQWRKRGAAPAMTSAERKINRLLWRAHQLAWSIGRFDVTVPVTQAVNILRRHTPTETERRLDDADYDQQAALDEQQITLEDLSKRGAP